MAAPIVTKLTKLAGTARDKGLFPLELAARAAAEDEQDLDNRINLVGALHESLKLRNAMEPFWNAWRQDEGPWLERIVTRLRAEDTDAWALVGFLGCSYEKSLATFRAQGFAVACVRQVNTFNNGALEISTLAPAAQLDEQLWSPVFEIGYDHKRDEVADAVRCRAVMFSSKDRLGDWFVGKASATYYLRASLPHGSWRTVSSEFDLPANQVARKP